MLRYINSEFLKFSRVTTTLALEDGMADKPSRGFSTRAIHVGRPPDSSTVPIYEVATLTGSYTRDRNPTVAALEERVADLEGGRRALATASGMAAISQTLMSLLHTGDRVLCHPACYVTTRDFMDETLARLGIQVSYVDMTDLDQVREALKTAPRLVFFEPLANPTLDVIDIGAVAALAHQADALVVVDNTFLTPYLLRPLELGADLVVHSATKYLSGHGDALGGIIVAWDESLLDCIYTGRCNQGGILSPFNAFLILRGIQTLPIRMDRHCRNAQTVAEFLSNHEHIAMVRYPGLASHPQHDLARRQLHGFGGMIGFEVAVSIARFCRSVRLCRCAVSLGDVTSLVLPIVWHGYTGQSGMVPRRYVRMSVGLEDIEDVIADLEQALNRAGNRSGPTLPTEEQP